METKPEITEVAPESASSFLKSYHILIIGSFVCWILGWLQLWLGWMYFAMSIVPICLMYGTQVKAESILQDHLAKSRRPSKMVHNDEESIMWLNTAIRQIWHQGHTEISNKVGDMVNEKLDALLSKRTLPVGVTLDKLDLGSTMPTLEAFKIFKTAHDIYELEFTAAYFSKAEVIVSIFVKVFGPFFKMPITLKHLDIKGRIRIELRLSKAIPFITRLRVSLVEPPLLHLSLCLGSFNILHAPWLSSLLWEQVNKQVEKNIVYPAEFLWQVPDEFEELRRSGPVVAGLVEVRLVEARSLSAADSGGTSDPYAVITIKKADGSMDSSQTKQTKYINQTLNPQWNEVFRFKVNDLCREFLYIEVKDHDLIGADDPLGNCSFELVNLFHIHARDSWIDLQQTHTGLLHLFVRFRSLDSKVTAMQRATEVHKLVRRNSEHQLLLRQSSNQLDLSQCQEYVSKNGSMELRLSGEIGSSEEAISDTRLKISFLTTEIMKKDGKHTEYLMECQLGPSKKWSISKRFREFHTFHCKMVKTYPKSSKIHFPPRTIGTSLSKEVISTRKARLQQYLQELDLLLVDAERRDLFEFIGASPEDFDFAEVKGDVAKSPVK